MKVVISTSLLLVLLLGGCSLLQKAVKMPTASIEKVELKKLSLSTADLEMIIDVTNPNKFSVPIAGFEYKLIIADEVIISGVSDKKQNLPKNGSSKISVPLSVEFAKVFASAVELAKSAEIEYRIEAKVSFDMPVIAPIKISHKGKIVVPKLPKLEIVSFKLKNLTLTGVELDIKIRIENLNTFALVFEKLGYMIKVADQVWVKSSLDNQKSIAPKGSDTISLVSKMSFLDIGTSFYKKIGSKEALKASFDGEFEMRPDHPLLEKLKIPLAKKDDLKL